MSAEWLFIGIFLVLGLILVIAPLLLAHFVAPRKPNPIKHQTYECVALKQWGTRGCNSRFNTIFSDLCLSFLT